MYFGSYNRAFLKETKDDLHMALIESLYGKMFGYRHANRGKIFNRKQDTVNDLKSLKDILRYNGFKQKNFKGDPSRRSPGNGISARYDLDHHGLANLSGGIDCKVTDSTLIKQLSAIVVSGPSNENNPNLKTFDWKDVKTREQHNGVPQRFDFPFVLMSPKTIEQDSPHDIMTFK